MTLFHQKSLQNYQFECKEKICFLIYFFINPTLGSYIRLVWKNMKNYKNFDHVDLQDIRDMS